MFSGVQAVMDDEDLEREDKLFELQHAQQAQLHPQIGSANLVEEQRAPIRLKY